MFLFVSCELTAPTSFCSRKIYWHLVWAVSMMDGLLLDGRSPISYRGLACIVPCKLYVVHRRKVTADCLTLIWLLVCLQLLSRWASVEVSACLRVTYVSSFREVFLPAISRSVQNRQTCTKIEYQTNTRKVYRHHYARYPVPVPVCHMVEERV